MGGFRAGLLHAGFYLERHTEEPLVAKEGGAVRESMLEFFSLGAALPNGLFDSQPFCTFICSKGGKKNGAV